jgi:hypothetical protein
MEINMNSFLNALYQDGVGKTVTGEYIGEKFMGTITDVRCTFGGGLNVYVALEDPIVIHNDPRECLVLDGAELAAGSSKVAYNLHVYF